MKTAFQMNMKRNRARGRGAAALVLVLALVWILFGFERNVFAQEQTAPVTALSTVSDKPAAEQGVSQNVEQTKTPISSQKGGKDGDNGKSKPFGALVTSFGALALTLGFFFGCIYLIKLLAPNRIRRSSGSIEILDSCFIGKKTELFTVKWGPKLLLTCISGEKTGVLAEISDKEDVEIFLETLKQDKENGVDIPVFQRLKQTLRGADTHVEHNQESN